MATAEFLQNRSVWRVCYKLSCKFWVGVSHCQFLSEGKKVLWGNYQVHGCSISVVRSHQKPRKKRKGKVSSLLMIILQLDRSRVQSMTLGLSLRSQTSVLRCKMDSAAKPSHRQARDTDNLLPLRFSFNGENVILPMFSRRVKQDSNFSGNPLKLPSQSSLRKLCSFVLGTDVKHQ